MGAKLGGTPGLGGPCSTPSIRQSTLHTERTRRREPWALGSARSDAGAGLPSGSGKGPRNTCEGRRGLASLHRVSRSNVGGIWGHTSAPGCSPPPPLGTCEGSGEGRDLKDAHWVPAAYSRLGPDSRNQGHVSERLVGTPAGLRGQAGARLGRAGQTRTRGGGWGKRLERGIPGRCGRLTFCTEGSRPPPPVEWPVGSARRRGSLGPPGRTLGNKVVLRDGAGGFTQLCSFPGAPEGWAGTCAPGPTQIPPTPRDPPL